VPETLKIEVELAKLAEQMLQVKHATSNINQKLDAVLPRREYEIAHLVLQERVKSLEADRKWLVRWLAGAWLAGVGVVSVGWKKLM
jgi:hypothetical protein